MRQRQTRQNGALFSPSAARVMEKHFDTELPWTRVKQSQRFFSSKWLVCTLINTSESKTAGSEDHPGALEPSLSSHPPMVLV